MRPVAPRGTDHTAVDWRAARLLGAPHRLCFFWAGVIWAAAATWWAGQQFAVALGLPWQWHVSPAAAHGLLFSLGAMPLFIAGFMFTAGPKWLRRSPVDARELRVSVGLFVVGWAAAVIGFHLGREWAAAGLAVVAVGWGGLSWKLARLVAGSPHTDRRHPWSIVYACFVIVACLGLAAWLMAVGQADLLRPVICVALWGGVTTVFLVVSHRLLPFLGAGAWPWLDHRWPDWPLWLVVSVPGVQSAGAIAAPWLGSTATWATARAFAAMHLAGAAALCLLVVLRWTRMPALRQPLVAMLYGAFVWWDVALWLSAAARWPGFDTSASAALELAAVHALTMGYLGGTLLVMATRVSSTHSGRPVAIDRVAWALYTLLQAALILRLVAVPTHLTAAPWLMGAAGAWMGVALVWAVRHGRWMGMPRADGRAD